MVDAVLDRQATEAAAEKSAQARADSLTAQLLRGARALVEKAARGEVNRAQARRAFVALYKVLHLVELARVAPEILGDVARAIEAEIAAAKEAGTGVEAIQAVERAARELEREAKKSDGDPKK